MSSNAGHSSFRSAFRACLNLINPSASSNLTPTSPDDSPIHNPAPSNIRQDPPPAVIPMVTVAHNKSDLQPTPKSITRQSDGWQALGTALKALETGVGIFPPLKAAVSELLACTMHIQIVEQNRREYDQLAANLVDLVQTLQRHLPIAKPRWMPYSIENVARSLSEQAAHIKQRQERWGVTQTVRAVDDEVDIVGCYRRIEHIFRQLQTDISLSIWDLEHEQWVNTHLKDLNSIHDARYNAAMSTKTRRQGCTANTRVNILREAIEWTHNPGAEKIYWMNGMAGTGKTTIAYTLCEQLEASKQLGACFFCSRNSPDCRNVSNIVPTVAYQLARFSNPYQKYLCEVLANNPDVARREISVQFEKLVVEPLLKVKDAMLTNIIAVLDALDECSDIQDTQLILELLSRHTATLPIKFFVTSRPAPAISAIFSSEGAFRRIFLLHEVEKSLVQADIHTYLEHELSIVQVGRDQIERLTARAGCLFIFAATVVRYIDPRNPAADHEARLTTMLGANTEAKGQAYQKLDELYWAILSQAKHSTTPDESTAQLLVLRTVISSRVPVDIPALTRITACKNEGTVSRALLPLRSVLTTSADGGVISVLHASFPDFMLDASRSKEFYCDMAEQDVQIARQCFDIMRQSLQLNICGLESSSLLDQDVPNLQARVDGAIDSGLSYACRYWGDHLYGAKGSSDLSNMLHEFLHLRLLFWMEVLNLKDWIGLATAILHRAFTSLPEDDELTVLREMIQDCRNFVTTYATNATSKSTPHIYISALPLASNQGFIRKTYWPRMKGLVRIQGTAIKGRSDAALATWATGSWVSKLTLSNDTRHMASGAKEGMVTIWDVSTGRRILGPLKKHEGTVYALAFSPDGARIASGSHDSKICIWNANNGETLPGSFEGHTACITGLIFSQDGERLISCSEDYTIRIWDSLTGGQIGTELREHTAAVMSIALSSDERILISGSDDHTIRVWDLNSRTTIVGPLEGHTDWIDWVALSPDDQHIASSSRDCTVRIWSIDQGKQTMNPLLGHTDRVWCVAYSPDGKNIVTGSFDKTARVWSAESGDLIAGPFRHEDNIYSVLFSLDGTYIISGSKDGTICIWDANHTITGETTVSVGHTGGILSIVLSPDGNRLISGSADHTICVWDTHDGSLILGPLTGHTAWIRSVACTPDGTCIVSGSDDCTIRTWDAYTGKPLADPFTGHTNWVMAVAVSPDGTLVASGSQDCSVKIWNRYTGAEVVNLPEHHTHWVNSVDFSPNGSYLASASDDYTVCLWDTTTSSLIRRLEQHTDGVTCARFSPDGSKLVTCSWDRTLLLWDVDTGAVLPAPWKGHNGPVRAASFSPDGAKVVSGDDDGRICIWDAEKGTLLAGPLTGHTNWVRSVAFTPDSKRIISGSDDSTIRFWDVATDDDIQHQGVGSWAVDKDGWVKDSESRLVVWLPPDLKRITPFPPCSLVIRLEGTVRADFSNLIYGDRWTECYTASSESNPSRY